jgi:SNF2 family DNA or RNA helicase
MDISGRVTPYPHQVDAAQRILTEKKVLLAYDVGVGKTLSCLLAGREYGGTVAVICPASVVENWKREAAGYLPDIKVFSAGKIPESISGSYMLIVDEAHLFQSIHSLRTRRMLRLAAGADIVVMSTATPIRNYPSNIFPLLRGVGHPLSRVYARFLDKYCDGRENGSSNLLNLHGNIFNYVINGEKEDFLTLPPFKRVMCPVSFEGEAKRLFDTAFEAARDEYRRRIAEGEISRGGHTIVLLNHLRQASALGKAVRAVKVAQDVLGSGHQVTLFTNFTLVHQYVAEQLRDYGPVTLSGAVPQAHRQGLVDRFQRGDSPVFIMTRAGSAGINLQAGSVFISIDRTWSPFDMIQAEGRIYRSGQRQACASIWLQDRVVDPFLDFMMLRKYRIARMVLAGKVEDMEGVGNPGVWSSRLSSILFGYK